jgi:tRNA(Ile)-lysidine synthase
MIEKLRKHLTVTLNIPARAKILVAVSGGMDSVALLHMLQQLDFDAGVAHANFQLRGDESDGDEVLVENIAANLGLKFYCKHFNTKTFATANKISTQMAARQLRYQWFTALCDEHGWQFIATAHHMDDQLETFFINLLRGTGLEGLKGIPARQDRIIRPLLPFLKTEIEGYVREQRLSFREDSSNAGLDYLRNRIRHRLLPLLDELSPAFRKVMPANLEHLAQAGAHLSEAVEKFRAQVLSFENETVLISISKIQQSKHAALMLHELLQDYGFQATQSHQLLKALDGRSGATFYSATHRLIKDREKLIIQPLDSLENNDEILFVSEETAEIFSPIHLQFQIIPLDDSFIIQPDPAKACLDFDTLIFPLKIRKWQTGDRFQPLGMKGSMKLSDFFITHKFSIAEKEKIWLITDAENNIVWIAGCRISQKNRITASTSRIFLIQMMD